jgi:hypothetical protein
MLRYEHMPSDFQPIFLFIGEAEDLAKLAGLLQRFARNPTATAVADAIPGAISRSIVTLVPADQEEFGMRERDEKFEWLLNGWQADRIAERIALLTPSHNKSGSEIVEVGSDGEIPVKVSLGEFTDDFLISKR